MVNNNMSSHNFVSLRLSSSPGSCSPSRPWTWRSPGSWQRWVCLALLSWCSESPGSPPAGSSVRSETSPCPVPASRSHRYPQYMKGRPRCPLRKSWDRERRYSTWIRNITMFESIQSRNMVEFFIRLYVQYNCDYHWGRYCDNQFLWIEVVTLH